MAHYHGSSHMDVSELRKRILRALEDARQDAASRRLVVDNARKAYEDFLTTIAVPVIRQAATVLKAEGHLFSVETPADSVRLVSDGAAQTFIDLALDTSGRDGVVVGRVSLARGRQGLVVDERPIADGKPVTLLTEEDLSAFLVSAIPRLLVRS
jgi:hypothetical protein